MSRGAAGAVLTASAILVLTGCAGPAPATFGSQQGVASTQCVHLAHGGRALIGDVLRTQSDPVTIRMAGLDDAHGVRVLRAWIVLNPAGGLSFGVTDVPPEGRTAAQLGWSSRVPAVGAQVPARSERNVVLEVEKTAATASAATAAAIRVEVGGTEVDSGIRYRFPARCF